MTIRKFLIFFLCFIAAERFCHVQTEGFRAAKIRSDLAFNPDWETPSLNSEELHKVESILSQPFYFLGKGGQCYAFMSEDGQSVLKVFKHHHMRPYSWLNKLPLHGLLDPIRNAIVHNRVQRLLTIFGSCKISAEEFKEETATLYAHLNKTTHLNRQIALYDKIKIKHLFDADSLEFVLQTKGELAFPTLTKLIKTGEIERAKEAIDSLLLLMLNRSKKGIVDHDPILSRNFGYIGLKAFEIDLGSFTKDTALKVPERYKHEFRKEASQLTKWVAKNHPNITPYLEQKIQHLLNYE